MTGNLNLILMNIAKPEDTTTLFLNSHYSPYGVGPARASVKRMLNWKGSFRALDASGQTLTWEEWCDSTRAFYYENQPYMRGGMKNGVYLHYPVPTIVVGNNSFFRFKKTEKTPSLKQLAAYYKNICQICLKKFKLIFLFIYHHTNLSFSYNYLYLVN